MKLRINSLLFAALLAAAVPADSSAQGTAFTYQGRLTTNNTPANGRFDFEFSLFSAESGGTPVSGPLALPGVGVTNGIFTVPLDFGAGVFSGQMGGPMAGLVPLISEMLGMESASIEYRNDGRHHSVKIGDGVSIEIDDVASPLDPSAPAPMLTGVHHPAASSLTVARGTASRVSAFGYEINLTGKSGFSAPFSWAG